MLASIDVLFEFASPYSYLAAQESPRWLRVMTDCYGGGRLSWRRSGKSKVY